MFKKLKWRIKRIWKGPGSSTQGSSLSDFTVFEPNNGGLERKLKEFCISTWRKVRKFLKWAIAAILLAAIAFFVPYLLGKWFN